METYEKQEIVTIYACYY